MTRLPLSRVSRVLFHNTMPVTQLRGNIYLLLNFKKLKLTRKKFDKNEGIVWSRPDARNPHQVGFWS